MSALLDRVNAINSALAGDFTAHDAIVKASDEKLTARIKKVHTAANGCTNWEVWTEFHVNLVGGGSADITFDGCRKCNVAMARA